MKIVADENIPHVEHFFGNEGRLILKPGRTINELDLVDANILLVRSVTRVDKDLLHNTSVKFVGSATTGLDHIDIDYLAKAGIHFSHASGCNSQAVVEYVICVVAALQKQHLMTGKKMRAGVIGVGNIGAKVVEKLKILNFDVIQYDPLRAENEIDFDSTKLENFQELDFISLHTPLTFDGKYPTHHMIDKNFLQQQRKGCVILNTSRGSVIRFSDLERFGNHLHWCLDVWEEEPNINLEILKKVLIATPHIAGYSEQSKYRGIEMLYQSALKHHFIQDEHINLISYPTHTISFNHSLMNWQDILLKIYNPSETTQTMKDTLLNRRDTFDNLRKNFQERHELNYVNLQDLKLKKEDKQIISALKNVG